MNMTHYMGLLADNQPWIWLFLWQFRFCAETIDLNIIYKNKSQEEKLKVHVIFVGMFLIFAHIAMIAGMVDPTIVSDMPSMGHNM